MIRLQLRRALTESEAELRKRAFRKAGVSEGNARFRIVKKSLDARDRSDIHYLYTVELCSSDEKVPEPERKRYRKPDHPIVVVGMGPAGLFAALTLSHAGLPMLLIERGKSVEERKKDVESFLFFAHAESAIEHSVRRGRRWDVFGRKTQHGGEKPLKGTRAERVCSSRRARGDFV